MATDIHAQTRFTSISAQKVRLLADLVRGKGVVEALTTLKFSGNQTIALPVYKTVASAMANAEENFGLSREDLVVHQIMADEGPTRKWRRFGARGRFKPLLRRTAHITVVLRERE
jgi:large subunit ribosomal protein L22